MLYVVDMTTYNATGVKPTAADVSSYPVNITCTGGNKRPWAIKVNNGKVYVGAVCDAQTSGLKADLSAFVVEYDPANSYAQQIVLDFPLTYPKGFSLFSYRSITGWFPWSDTWSAKIAGTAFGGSANQDILRPEPIFGDLEFDIDGSIVIGLNDRTGLQSGVSNYAPTGTSTQLYSGYVAGDILRGYFSNGVFILENNAKAGPNTGDGPNNSQGPGFGEFYNDNSKVVIANNLIAHAENVMGGLALRPGSGEVLAAVLDPIDLTSNQNLEFFAGGIRHWSNTSGLTNSAYQVYATNSGSSPGSFSKATGLGDLELLCAAPDYLEIGNRVWIASDGDGV